MTSSADWLPTSAAGQNCMFCGVSRVAWVHPLDQQKVRYRVHGKEYTLPHFVTVCDG